MNEQKPPKTSDYDYYMLALRIMGDFGIIIAAPVVAFVLVGQYLDDLYGTRPRFMLISFAVSFIVSGMIIYKKTKKHEKAFKELNGHSRPHQEKDIKGDNQDIV